MAIVEIGGVKHYTAASTDTKPTAGVPAGSTLWEVTAGEPPVARKWLFDGAAWALVALDDPASE